jgi:hypothetical protein
LYYQYKLIWLSENKICLIVRGEYDSSSRGHPVLPSSQGTLAPGQGVSLGTGGPFKKGFAFLALTPLTTPSGTLIAIIPLN